MRLCVITIFAVNFWLSLQGTSWGEEVSGAEWTQAVGKVITLHGSVGEKDGQPVEEESPGVFGTGFVVGDRGWVVTNVHVVSDARTVIFRCGGHDYRVLGVVGYSLNYDLAVLQLDSVPPFSLALAPTIPAPGEYVATAGFPLEKWTTDEGTRQAVEPQLGPNGCYLVSIIFNGGASGSPVVDQEGRVLGVAAETVETGGKEYGVVMPVTALAVILKRIEAQASSSAVKGSEVYDQHQTTSPLPAPVATNDPHGYYPYDRLIAPQIQTFRDDAQFQAAARDLLQMRGPDAYALFYALTKKYPKAPLIWYCTALAALQNKQQEDARRDFQQAVNAGLDGGPYWIPIGRDISQQDGLGEMVLCLDASRAYYNLAVLNRQAGVPDREIVPLLKKAVALRPRFADAWLYLGDVYADMGQSEVALDDYLIANQILPGSAPIWMSIGDAYVSLGKRDKAKEAYTQALTLDPSLDAARMAIKGL